MTTHVARSLAIAAFRPGDRAAGDAALARIAGPDGDAARTLLAAMHGLDGTALVTRIRRELAAPRPAHWRAIHPTWIEGAVPDGEGAHERWLARALLGGFVAMRDPALPPDKGVAGLVSLDADRLAVAIMIIGRRQVVHALGRKASQIAAELGARLGWGRELATEIASVWSMSAADAERQLGRASSALARLDGVNWAGAQGPFRIGLRALAPSVQRVPDLDQQIAQRLPRPIGQVARADLAFVGPPDGVDRVEIARAHARASVGPSRS